MSTEAQYHDMIPFVVNAFGGGCYTVLHGVLHAALKLSVHCELYSAQASLAPVPQP